MNKQIIVNIAEHYGLLINDNLIEFAREIELIEREECAKICDDLEEKYIGEEGPVACHDCASSIRSRK